jgi:hypothetical protein
VIKGLAKSMAEVQEAFLNEICKDIVNKDLKERILLAQRIFFGDQK